MRRRASAEGAKRLVGRPRGKSPRKPEAEAETEKGVCNVEFKVTDVSTLSRRLPP